MKGKSYGETFCECETDRLHIEGGTRQSSPDAERNPSQDREHSGKGFHGHDRHLVNRQNGREDNATAAQPLSGEFGEPGSRRRTLARDAVRRPITLPINGEASSVNEDQQSMMKELLASRGQVESLKRELAVLKRQMSETLKPEPAASKDLQNAKLSPAGAKLFLPMSNSDPLATSECNPGGSWNSSALIAWRETAANHIAGLTQRQREVMELVLAGRPSKNIAAHLGISQRTVENHRASIMKKTGSKSLPALTRLALFAAGSGADGLLLLGGLPVIVLQRRVHS